MLKNNINKINWKVFAYNPSIFCSTISDELGEKIIKEGTKKYPKTMYSKPFIDNINEYLGGTNNSIKKRKRKSIKRRKRKSIKRRNKTNKIKGI